MLRATRRVCMKPFVHALSPGARASEKGMLYRNGNMNAFARVGSIHYTQRSRMEGYVHSLLLMPDQMFYIVSIAVGGIVLLLCYLLHSPFTRNEAREHLFTGTLNENEHYVRRSDMERVLASHAEMIAGTRGHIERPAVYDAPGNYVSYSGRYAPRDTTTTS